VLLLSKRLKNLYLQKRETERGKSGKKNLNKEIMKGVRTSRFVMLTLPLGLLSIYIITQGTSIPTTPPANATSTTNLMKQNKKQNSNTDKLKQIS
jgi:hypothetical protein